MFHQTEGRFMWRIFATAAILKLTIHKDMPVPRTSEPSVKVNLTVSYWVSALFTQCPGDTVQTGTGKSWPGSEIQM